MSTSTATAYEYNVAGHLSFGAPKCEKAQKSSGFWANCTYRLCIKDNVLIDPCMGSAHFLVYAFDVLMAIYEEKGYSQRDAAISIAEKNLYGLDIDKRAYQLSYFALMMKVRRFNRRALRKEDRVKLNIAYVRPIDYNTDFVNLYSPANQKIVKKLLDDFKYGDELGSIIQPSLTVSELNGIIAETETIISSYYDNIFDTARQGMIRTDFIHVLKQTEILLGKYDVVATNPPFLNKMDKHLKKYVTDFYKDYSTDLFSVFIYRNFSFCKTDGYSGFMSPFVWMFIKSYEKLRTYILTYKALTTLVQMEYSAFEEATVPICTFVMKNARLNNNGLYFRLTEFKGGMKIQGEKVLEAIKNPNCGYFYESNSDNFSKIPGSPVAYWVSDRFRNAFQIGDLLGSLIPVKKGMDTGNNDYFLKYWFEVSVCTIDYTNHLRKWVPYDKGGDYRKWYGNNEYVLNWECDGIELKNSKANLRSKHLYFIPSITWSALSASNTSFRYSKYKGAFDSAGSSMFPNRDRLFFFLGLMNTKVVQYYLNIINPTLNYGAGSMAQVPVIIPEAEKVLSSINTFVEENIYWSESDWDSFETSWDFKKHPFLAQSLKLKAQSGVSATLISECYKAWEQECEQRFNQLKANEEELNRIFIDIYGLQDELTPDVEDKDVTVRKADLKRDVKSFVSYAVGCMFGRYSIYQDGLIYAGEKYSLEDYIKRLNSRDCTVSAEEINRAYHNEGVIISELFAPDDDNCIPITDTRYFSDDIVSKFEDFLVAVYGAETLENNLDFIANALGNKGNTSREVIRNYFLNDFFKDHCKIYQKRPIYWLFDSGKQNGFKALVYMHRWNADTIGNVRVEYLHRIQRVYEREIEREQDTIDNSNNSRDKAAAAKRKEKLVKQLRETRDYDTLISHLALSRIDIDLDDGVKVNYEKVQTGQDGKKLAVLGKI
ncbi:MAG: BREX-1 system adenine-specific DNA-methyltransferase PglX [Acutalibacteraceae bacterium]|nr:BREX-1 system adenine-specific DNA-methyltransferase PglX [Acutalibacteraceae bacterium]